jgi:ribosomal protein S18 acetylase RimI-like enzyme
MTETDSSTIPSFTHSDLLIRKVDRDDLEALEWGGEFLKYRRMYAEIFRTSNAGKSLMWLVELPGVDVLGQAFVLLKSVDLDAADGINRAYLFAFRVKPQWQNHGIGQYLMQFIEQDLQKRGFRYVTLNVARENLDAIRLYQRLGYKIIGPRSGVWSFRDHEGRLQQVNEPSWRMMKRIGAKKE